LSDTKKNQRVLKSLDGFARGLLATTCLTVACGASALAGTINEVGDFPNSGNGTLLPVGTDVVNGSIGGFPFEGPLDTADWFEFQGLTSGNSFHLTGAYNPLGAEAGASLQLFTDGGTPLGNGTLESGGAILNGIVPGDGKLVVEILGSSQTSNGYTVSLSTSSAVPEPSTLGGTGLALAAGALAWSRKRKR
jgi:hypothetical protein